MIHIKVLKLIFFKGGINANIKFLTAAITLLGEKKPYAGEAMIKEVHSMLQELKQLHSLLDTRYTGISSLCPSMFFWGQESHFF